MYRFVVITNAPGLPIISQSMHINRYGDLALDNQIICPADVKQIRLMTEEEISAAFIVDENKP